jgi:hypothetical protein
MTARVVGVGDGDGCALLLAGGGEPIMPSTAISRITANRFILCCSFFGHGAGCSDAFVHQRMCVRWCGAFFGSITANGPSGLESLTGAQEVNGGGGFGDLDAFAEALFKLDQVDSILDRAFVTNPHTLLDLPQIKLGTDFNAPLLGPDATSPNKPSILGVPLFWAPAIPQGRLLICARITLTVNANPQVAADFRPDSLLW